MNHVAQVGTWLTQTTESFKAAGIDSPHLDALLLLEDCLDQKREFLLAHPKYPINAQALAKLTILTERRIMREPLAYIRGCSWFYGLKLQLDKAVLIPRPETEELVEQASKQAPGGGTIVEIGTGSGAISVALSTLRPDLHITATDISADALTIALLNASECGDSKAKPIHFVQRDLLHNMDGWYDLLVANLPYVADNQAVSPETMYEPKLALYGGHDGLALYRRLFEQLGKRSHPIPKLILEAEPGQSSILTAIAEAVGYQPTARTDGFCYVFSYQDV